MEKEQEKKKKPKTKKTKKDNTNKKIDKEVKKETKKDRIKEPNKDTEKKKRKGFTLVELLVAITILGIIMVIALPQINSLQNDNSKTKYEKYAEFIAASSRLYTDSNTKDMFGNSPSGCYDIKYSQLRDKNLIDDIKVDGATCASTDGTFVRVYKSGNHYTYYAAVECRDKNGNVVYSQDIPSGKTCDGLEPDFGGPDMKISPNGSDWTTGQGLKVKITVSDDYGLAANAQIKYAWVKESEKNNVPESKYTLYNFGNKQYDGTTSAPKTINIDAPQGLNGKYYLVIKPEKLRDANGNYNKTTLVSNVFKFDNNAPTISISNSSNGEWTNQDVVVTVTGNDTVSEVTKIYYGYSEASMTLDDWTTTNKSSPKLVVTKSYNFAYNKQLYAYAVDAAGNVSATSAGSAIKIDKTNPTCDVIISGTKGDNSWYKTNVSVSVSTSDADSKVATYDLTTSATPTYNKNNDKTQSDTTTVTWYGYVKDNAGNTGSCSKSFKVDTKTPSCSLNATTSGITVGSATDNGTSGLAYYGWNSSYSGTNSLDAQALAVKTYTYYVKDNAGNKNTCSKRVTAANANTEYKCDSAAITRDYSGPPDCNVYNGVFSCTYKSDGTCYCKYTAFQLSGTNYYCCPWTSNGPDWEGNYYERPKCYRSFPGKGYVTGGQPKCSSGTQIGSTSYCAS